MSDDAFDQSVTVWIQQMKAGQDGAAQQIWDRFFDKLVRVADRKMGSAERRVADQEDVAVSVFESLCIGARQGRFDGLHDRNDLWKLMVAIAGMKSVDQIRRQTSQKRGSGQVRGDSIAVGAGEIPAGFEQFISQDPTPEFLAELDEQQSQLFGLLPDETQRQIATLRMEGYSNQEIADKLDISIRTVERKLGLIREIWSTALPPGSNNVSFS